MIEGKAHRYEALRYAAQALTLGVLLGVPMTGLARVDLFSGGHAVLFRTATWREGLAGVIVGIAACYVVTFAVNAVFGRLFCGWGCPVGFLNRLADVADVSHDAKKVRWWRRMRDWVGPYGHSLLLTFTCLCWWTNPMALLAIGRPAALGFAWGFVLVGTGALAWLGVRSRWAFCMKACPVGLYYSFVAPNERFGIQFAPRTADGSAEACLHCQACVKSCPVLLDPMHLAQGIGARGGMSIADVPGGNHCLKCGDCVQACEFMIEKSAARRGIREVPLWLGAPRKKGPDGDGAGVNEQVTRII